MLHLCAALGCSLAVDLICLHVMYRDALLSTSFRVTLYVDPTSLSCDLSMGSYA